MFCQIINHNIENYQLKMLSIKIEFALYFVVDNNDWLTTFLCLLRFETEPSLEPSNSFIRRYVASSCVVVTSNVSRASYANETHLWREKGVHLVLLMLLLTFYVPQNDAALTTTTTTSLSTPQNCNNNSNVNYTTFITP